MCSREEGEHRREPFGSIGTPSDDERLEMSNHYFGKSHLGGRKSSTGVASSFLWQLGKFLDIAIGIVPAPKLLMTMFLYKIMTVRP